MQSIQEAWTDINQIPGAGWIIGISGLLIFLTVAYYFLTLIRNMAVGTAQESTDYITDFQKLRDEGKLDEEEYSRLAQAIPKKVPREIDSSNENNLGANSEIENKKRPKTLAEMEALKKEQSKESD